MDYKLPLSRSIYSTEYVPFCETLWLHHVSGRTETLCYVEEKHVAELRGSSSPDPFLETLVRPLNAAHYYSIAVPNEFARVEDPSMKRFRDLRVLLQAALVGGAAMGSANAFAADADCKTIAAALARQIHTPTHAWVTRTSEAESETTSEVIFADGVQYVQQYNAWWRGATLKDIQAREKTIAERVASRCEKLPDETIGDVPAHVFRREDRPREDADGPARSVLKVWISTKRGVPLREEFEFGSGDAPHSRIVKRFEYDKVSAPVGARVSPITAKPAG